MSTYVKGAQDACAALGIKLAEDAIPAETAAPAVEPEYLRAPFMKRYVYGPGITGMLTAGPGNRGKGWEIGVEEARKEQLPTLKWMAGGAGLGGLAGAGLGAATGSPILRSLALGAGLGGTTAGLVRGTRGQFDANDRTYTRALELRNQNKPANEDK